MEWSDKIRKAFFVLLRAGLWNGAADDVSCFPLSEGEWKCVWMHAMRQSVRGLIFDGVCLLPEQMMPNVQLLMAWTAEIDRVERRNRQMNGVLMKMMGLLKDQKELPLVLKGQGVAQFYEHPLLRECGDIDVYFTHREDEQFLLDRVRSKGGNVVREPDGTSAYVLDGIDVEHHNRIFDLYAPGTKEYLCELIQNEGFMSLSLHADDESSICVLSPKLNLISLNAHILKHLLGHGIGLRQFCDMARAYHVLRPEYDGAQLQESYRRCGLTRWSRLLHTLLVRELGLPEADLPYEESLLPTADALLDRVMATGNFGKFTAARVDTTQSVWKRKLHTGLAFLGNLRFSLTYAPKETFGLVGDLFLGNIKS